MKYLVKKNDDLDASFYAMRLPDTAEDASVELIDFLSSAVNQVWSGRDESLDIYDPRTRKVTNAAPSDWVLLDPRYVLSSVTPLQFTTEFTIVLELTDEATNEAG